MSTRQAEYVPSQNHKRKINTNFKDINLYNIIALAKSNVDDKFLFEMSWLKKLLEIYCGILPRQCEKKSELKI